MLFRSNNLQQLTFGLLFNKKIKKDVLPNNLQQLTFGLTFNNKIKKDVLPNSLLKITFGRKYTQKLKNVLPITLKYIIFNYCDRYYNYNIQKIIKNIKSNIINNNIILIFKNLQIYNNYSNKKYLLLIINNNKYNMFDIIYPHFEHVY